MADHDNGTTTSVDDDGATYVVWTDHDGLHYDIARAYLDAARHYFPAVVYYIAAHNDGSSIHNDSRTYDDEHVNARRHVHRNLR